MTVTTKTVSSGYSTGTINENFQTLEDYINSNLLNRDGTSTGEVNQLELPLDMNGFKVFNLPAPIDQSEAVRLQDLQAAMEGGAANIVSFEPYQYITSTTVQGAIEQVVDKTESLVSSEIGFSPYGYVSSSTVEGALQEIIDETDDLSASFITFSPYENISSTDVQGAVQELVDGTGQAATTSTGKQTLVESLNDREIWVQDLSSLKALSSSLQVSNAAARITTTGRAGSFRWASGDQSANVSGDTQEGIWVAPDDDATGASGAWERTDPVLTPEMFGAVGDGVADDTDALNGFFLNTDEGQGTVGATYAYSSQVDIRGAGAKYRFNGSKFKYTGTDLGTDATLRVAFAAGVDIDKIEVDVPTGVVIRRVLEVMAADARIGHIKVSSVDQQNNRSSPEDAAVTVDNFRVRIDIAEITNFDNPIFWDSRSDGFLGETLISSYVRGIYVKDCKNLFLGNFKAAVSSPNASYTAGHNAILIESTSSRASSGIKIDKPHIEDAGEHGIRLGGQFTIEDTIIDHPVVINSGGSGIKALGAAGELHEGLVISSPIIVDAGQDVNNKSGVLVQRCRFVQVTSPAIFAKNKTFSAFNGVRLTNVSDVIVSNPSVTDTADDGVLIDSGGLGGSSRVTIDGGQIRNAGTRGFHLNMGSQDYSHIMVKNRLFITGCPEAFDFEVTTGSLTRAFFSAELYFNTASGDALGVVMAEIVGELDAGVTFRNGSTYMDYDSQEFKVRKSGTWTAL